MENQKSQQDAMMYQILQKHMESLRQRGTLLESKMMELQATRESLGDLGKGKTADMLVPLGSGCYMSGKSEDTGNVLVSVGAGILLKRNTKDALEFIEGQEKELVGAGEKLQKELESVSGQMNTLVRNIEMAAQNEKK